MLKPGGRMPDNQVIGAHAKEWHGCLRHFQQTTRVKVESSHKEVWALLLLQVFEGWKKEFFKISEDCGHACGW